LTTLDDVAELSLGSGLVGSLKMLFAGKG